MNSENIKVTGATSEEVEYLKPEDALIVCLPSQDGRIDSHVMDVIQWTAQYMHRQLLQVKSQNTGLAHSRQQCLDWAKQSFIDKNNPTELKELNLWWIDSDIKIESDPKDIAGMDNRGRTEEGQLCSELQVHKQGEAAAFQHDMEVR